MRKIFLWLIGLTFVVLNTLAVAEQNCSQEVISKTSQHTLACYLLEPENSDQPLQFTDKQYDAHRNVYIEKYTLNSQQWPKPWMSTHGIVWKHTLIIYRPPTLKTHQALLFINGGTRYPSQEGEGSPAHQLDFARIAAETHSIVVDLQDIPNQFLSFEDHVYRKEDSIIAYTWNRYMDDSDQNKYWPLYLPMTKAVIKAMDAVQKTHTEVQSFVVAGASKRGLAAWLATLSDQRINAIVPIVIDILNTKKNLQHIFTSYDNHWPLAFYDYIEQKIPERMNTPAFEKLINIEDPIAYLSCAGCGVYKKRLSLPKYIISASGDDFFVPDSLNQYLDKLPGETMIRVVPNQSHYIDMKIVEEALLRYYQTIINHTVRPTLTWNVDEAGKLKTVITDQEPLSIKLWEATNPNARDFRLWAEITYAATELKGKCMKHHCRYEITITPPVKGWKASFVEATYQQPKGGVFVLTTPAYVIGST